MVLFFAAAFAAAAVAAPRGAPVAVVLEVTGAGELLGSGSASTGITPFLLLRPGNRMAIRSGRITVKFLKDGHREMISGTGTVTLGPEGFSSGEKGITVRKSPARVGISLPGQQILLGDKMMQEAHAQGLGNQGTAASWRPVVIGPSTALTRTPYVTGIPASPAKPHLVRIFDKLELLRRLGHESSPLWEAWVTTDRLAYPKTAPPLEWGKEYEVKLFARDTAGALREVEMSNNVIKLLPEETVREIQRLVAKPNQSSADLAELASLYLVNGLPAEALHPLRELAARHPSTASIRYLLVAALWGAGEREEALREKTRFERDFPDSPFPIP